MLEEITQHHEKDWGTGGLGTAGNMEEGDTLIIFVLQNCLKAFLPKEIALARLSQIVANALNITDCWTYCCPPNGSDHDLMTISLNLTEKFLGTIRDDPSFFATHTPPDDLPTLRCNHSVRQTNVTSLLGRTNRTEWSDYPQVVPLKIRTGLNYWNLFGNPKAYQPVGRPHWRHCQPVHSSTDVGTTWIG